MSNGKLKDNISILDLPAFASSIGTLEKNQKRESGWPTELNFAIMEVNKNVNVSNVFSQYKILLEHWARYMDRLNFDDTDYGDYYTEDMANNECLNFTKYLGDDMQTFLLALAGMYVSTVLFL